MHLPELFAADPRHGERFLAERPESSTTPRTEGPSRSCSWRHSPRRSCLATDASRTDKIHCGPFEPFSIGELLIARPGRTIASATARRNSFTMHPHRWGARSTFLPKRVAASPDLISATVGMLHLEAITAMAIVMAASIVIALLILLPGLKLLKNG